MAFCSQCGAKNDEGAKFCGSCGKVIADERGQVVLSANAATGFFQSLTFGRKISFSGAGIAFVCFFLPWVKACGASLSGLDIVTKGPTKDVGLPGLLFLILIPACSAFILWMIFQLVNGQLDKKTADDRILIASIVPLVTLIIFFFWAKNKLGGAPTEIFTFWFLLTILSFAGSAFGAYSDKLENTSETAGAKAITPIVMRSQPDGRSKSEQSATATKSICPNCSKAYDSDLKGQYCENCGTVIT